MVMKMNKKFIIVKDKPTADKLSAAGFILLSQIGGTYTFKNDQGKLNFASIDAQKICFTDKLMF